MIKRKTDIRVSDLPDELHEILGSGTLYDSSCSPHARTLYCDTGYYIKSDRPGSLAREAELGRLFHRLGLGVEVVRYISADRDWLVTRSAPGEDLTHFLGDPELLCRVLAEGLRRLHSTPPGDAPVSPQHLQYPEAVREDCSGSGNEPCLLMGRYRVGSRQEAREILRANAHRLKADALIHGDACLPNILCHEGRFCAFIDLGLAGLGDKHTDLFWAIWSLQFNLKTDAYTDRFLDLYGRENFDPHMLRTAAALEALG